MIDINIVKILLCKFGSAILPVAQIRNLFIISATAFKHICQLNYYFFTFSNYAKIRPQDIKNELGIIIYNPPTAYYWNIGS